MEIKYIRFLNVYKISIRTSLNYLNFSKLDKYHSTIYREEYSSTLLSNPKILNRYLQH